ncbi:restriction endonuclease subunit S [Listeria portnoyi]|uniref:restriction endonuclease subunit S n=1 Tax=Listeria portnoyi TaxID=2713504 RepID=UPI0031B5FE05
MQAWEQRKLGDVAVFSKGNGYTKNDLTEKGTPIVFYGRLYTRYEIVINNVDTFVEKKDKSVISEGNEVVVPASGETAADISRASVIGTEGFILGGDLNIIKPKKKINSVFLALTISNGTQQKEMSKRAQGKSVVHLHNSDLKQVNLLYPSYGEQQQIMMFFLQLDNTIALHQRKLNALKLMKQGFLQQMFPVNGEKVPKVRFIDFEEHWKQRKLGELATSFEYGLNASSKKYDGKNKYIRITDIDESSHMFSQDNITSPDTNLVHADNYLLEVGDILFARTGASVGKSYYYNGKDGSVYYAGFLIRAKIKQEYDAKFIFQNTLTTNYKNFIQITSQRSGQPGINAREYAGFYLSIPKLEEQRKIGLFFTNLEDTIILYQNKLDMLNILKKAYLKNMFI